ncbi:MAG: ATP-binding cassette domain-containing protein, partial [Asgard group archaeon]|nr:ATP-binding cassette domain-containing protein [Asgard group archaeon]
ALEIVELEDFAQRPIGHLSGGQQQKALLARAIVNEPEILFLDEPTSSLDVKVSKNVMEVIQKIRQKTKSTIVMATHDLNFIKQSCTRSLCLYKRIIWKGDPEEDEFNKVITKVFQA